MYGWLDGAHGDRLQATVSLAESQRTWIKDELIFNGIALSFSRFLWFSSDSHIHLTSNDWYYNYDTMSLYIVAYKNHNM